MKQRGAAGRVLSDLNLAGPGDARRPGRRRERGARRVLRAVPALGPPRRPAEGGADGPLLARLSPGSFTAPLTRTTRCTSPSRCSPPSGYGLPNMGRCLPVSRTRCWKHRTSARW